MARILVIEDSPTQAAEAAFVLEDAGFEVEIAGDGAEGFECVKTGTFDLVLSDVIMPRMSGFELCRKVKAEVPGVTVFLFTTLNRTVDILRGLECGADGYINKPYQPDVLVERIQNQLALTARRAAAEVSRENATVFEGQEFSLPSVPPHVLDYVVSVIAYCSRERETAGAGALRSAEALRRSEERFALAVSGANDGLWDWDIESNQMYCSPRWKAIAGYQEDEIEAGLDVWRDHIHADDRERFTGDLAAHADGKIPHFENEHRLRHTDGTYRWVLARGLCLRDAAGKATRMAGSLTDVTERRWMEEQLCTASTELKAVLRAFPDRCFLLDGAGTIVDCHGGRDELTADEASGVVGKPIGDVLAPGASGSILDALARARDQLVTVEYAQANGCGDRMYEARFSPLSTDHVLATVRDITERKRQEVSLRLTQFSVDYGPDAVTWIERDGRFLYVNESTACLLGYTRDEMLGKTAADVSPDITPENWVTLWNTVKGRGSITARGRYRTKDGRITPVEFTASILELDGKEYLCTFARDTSEHAAFEFARRAAEVRAGERRPKARKPPRSAAARPAGGDATTASRRSAR